MPGQEGVGLILSRWPERCTGEGSMGGEVCCVCLGTRNEASGPWVRALLYLSLDTDTCLPQLLIHSLKAKKLHGVPPGTMGMIGTTYFMG